MSGKQNDYRVAVFGCGGVGKSSLVNRFVNNTFKDVYIPTIEDTYRQVINCNKQVCTLEITDTTGSHQFPAMQQLCISKGHAFILVYSVTNKGSFDELINIHNQLFRIKREELSLIPLMIVGNKCDEENSREVSEVQASALAKRLGCGFIETSAKLNKNVTEMFQELLQMETRRNIALVMTKEKQSLIKRLFSPKAKESGGAADGRKSVINFDTDKNGIFKDKAEPKKDKAKKKEAKEEKKTDPKAPKADAKASKAEAKAAKAEAKAAKAEAKAAKAEAKAAKAEVKEKKK